MYYYFIIIVLLLLLLLFLLFISKESAVKGWERVSENTIVPTPNPTKPTDGMSKIRK